MWPGRTKKHSKRLAIITLITTRGIASITWPITPEIKKTGANPATVASYLGLLESGDEVYITAWHSYGSARNTQPSTGTSQNYTFFRGFRIGQLWAH